MTYQPHDLEMIPVLTAINFERQMLGKLDDLDLRYNAGYIDGVCATMASQDPYLEDAGDRKLMIQIVERQRCNMLSVGDRKHAYLAYIRQAAALMEISDAQV